MPVRRKRLLESIDIARHIVEATLDKQATNVVLLDARELISFADYFVICTGESDRQIEAIAREVDDLLNSLGSKTHRREGSADSGWILVDAGDVVIHIFDPATRDFYGLDSLWESATALMRVQ